MTGIRREKRNQESLGKNDAPGMMRIKGDKGHEGSHGSGWPPGIKVWKESRDLKERKEKSWIVQCHRPTGNSVCGKEIIIKIVERSK